MRPAAFSDPGRFWRGNLHTHSTLSDGALGMGEVCRAYRERGYDFIALTDHFVGMFGYPIADTRAHRGDGFTTLIGAELHSGAQENGNLWHILAIGLPDDFAPSDSPGFLPHEGQESGGAIARRAAEAGAFVAIAHPEWSGLSEADMREIDAAHAVEIYNHGCAVESDRGRGHHAADLLAGNGRRLGFIATDDAHFQHGPLDAFGGWTMVKAEENTPEALLRALKAGAMYASTGPDFFDVEIGGGEVSVRCSPSVAVILAGAGVATVVEHGAGLTDARLKIGRLESSPWLRVTLIDAAGRRAWTNPIWRD